MKIFVGLVSSNSKICDVYQREQASLIPKEVLSIGRQRGLNLSFHVGVFNPSMGNRSIEDYLHYATRHSDAALLIIEQKHYSIAEAIHGAFFASSLAFEDCGTSLRNFFGSILTRLLKNFFCLLDTMQRADNEHVMILPLRNFSSGDLQELVRVCREESSSNTFNNSIGTLVTRLKSRKKPRRNSNYRNTYLVDDDEKFFEYGKEKHAKLPTGKPHTISCELSGNFRFGKRIASDRHFNVTRCVGDQTRISGEFPNCHDEMILVKETTHLNMFSNDYH